MVILMNFPPPTEGIHHSEPNVTAHYKNKILGKGILYISESVLCWISCTGEGFSLQYPSIFMHAISRDTTNFPQECLYMMIDGTINLVEEPREISSALDNLTVGGGQDQVPVDSISLNNLAIEDRQDEGPALNNLSVGETQDAVTVDSSTFNNLSVEEEQVAFEEDYDEPTAEMRFVPDNIIMLDIMFQALSDCQALNPDPGESDAGDAVIAPPPFIISDENGFSIEFEDCEEGEEPMNEEQFEDAEQ